MSDLRAPAGAARPSRGFWAGKRVLLTGHTGFKGAWLAMMLDELGARVHGFALAPEPGPNLFDGLGVGARLAVDGRGDLRDAAAVTAAVEDAQAEIVLHLAAQAMVGRGHRDPSGTFATNLGGTVNVLEALRNGAPAASMVVVTSDKVYLNDGKGRPFREDDPLGGSDPYSASKAACEMAAASYARSFPERFGVLATARAGNVIGGGDFGEDRLIPDLVRAETAGEALVVRRPKATRPFQHVLDVLAGYLLLAEALAGRPDATPRALNFGPREREISVEQALADIGRVRGRPVEWRIADPNATYPEAPRLALDASLAREALGWRPRLAGDAAFAETMAWYDAWRTGRGLGALSARSIAETLA